jgi:glycosyltransferase involved in cell wall biosynthesis
VSPLAFVVPGSLDQLTGGYLFDRRIVDGLRTAGRRVDVIELAGAFPEADATARASFGAALAALPDGAAVAIDGLALPGGSDGLDEAARRLRLVAFVHHPLALETGLSAEERSRVAALERDLLRPMRGAICPSRRTEAALLGYGMDESRVVVVPPGTDPPAAPPRVRETGGPVRLLCVATVTPRKGHAVLVEALAGLADLDWRLTCLGSVERDAATAASLQRRIAESGVAERIVLAGERASTLLSEAYRDADVFVLASYHEGYGMAFAEAMAHGLPIVGTMAGAIPETVPAEAGLLVPPGDAASLGAALRRIIADADLRFRLARGAEAAGRRLPSWSETVRRWGAAFDRLAA